MSNQDRVISKAGRILGAMAAFRTDVEPPPGLDDVIGVYEARQGGEAIWVGAQGIAVGPEPRVIRYRDMRSVRGPSSKDKASVESRRVTVTLADGEGVVLEVAGGEGQFCDAFEFSRFLDRVVKLYGKGD